MGEFAASCRGSHSLRLGVTPMVNRRRRLAAWAVAVSLSESGPYRGVGAVLGSEGILAGRNGSGKAEARPVHLERAARARGAPRHRRSLPEQIARVYRNGVEIGVAKVSTGKPGHNTPTGIFTILNKDKDHRSKTYGNAPMPYSERLTWDGVALHAGGSRGIPESHGCVHLPTRFAELLFGITSVGMTVVIASDASAPADVAHAGFLSPVSARGAEDAEPRLASGRRVAVGAREIGRGSGDGRRQRGGPEDPGPAQRRRDRPRRDHDRVPGEALGNEAFLLKAVSGAPADTDTPGGARWLGSRCPVRASARERRWT